MGYVNWKKTRELHSDYVMKNVFWPGFLVPEPAAAETNKSKLGKNGDKLGTTPACLTDQTAAANVRLDAYEAGRASIVASGRALWEESSRLYIGKKVTTRLTTR